MHADKVIHVVEMPLCHNGFRSVIYLFRRLEDKLDLALELVFFCEKRLSYTEAHGCMGVVPAGMYAALVTGNISFVIGSEACLVGFLAGKAVYVESECCDRSRDPCVEDGDNSREALSLLNDLRFSSLSDGTVHVGSSLLRGPHHVIDGGFVHYFKPHKAVIAHICQYLIYSGCGSYLIPSLFGEVVEFSSVLDKLVHFRLLSVK